MLIYMYPDFTKCNPSKCPSPAGGIYEAPIPARGHSLKDAKFKSFQISQQLLRYRFTLHVISDIEVQI